MKRSIRWLDRCIEFHEESGKSDTQNLFAIVQGGLDPVMRDECLDEMIKRRDKVAGYAIGGLSGGEEKGMSQTLAAFVFELKCHSLMSDIFWRMWVASRLFCRFIYSPLGSIRQCAEKLPADSELDVLFQHNVTDTK